MGLASATFRLVYLESFRHDLEMKIQTITESKLSLTKTIDELVNVGNDMDPESETVKQLQARRDKLNALDKKLDAQLQLYKSQLEMVNTEIESAEKLRDKTIERSFKYG